MAQVSDGGRAIERLAFAAMLLIWATAAVFFWQGSQALGPDSVTYLDAARSLADGHGYAHRWAYWDPVYESGRLPTSSSMWPPGLSLAIAAGMTAGLDGQTAGRIVVSGSFVGLVVLIFLLCRTWLTPRLAGICALMAVAPMPHPTPEAAFVASEIPFLFTSTFAMFGVARAVSAEGRKARALWWTTASIAAGTAFLMRYVGLAVVGAVAVIAAAAWLNRRLSAVGCVLAVAPGSAVVAGVMIRNRLVSGHFGQPWPGADIFWSTLPGALKSIASLALRVEMLEDRAPAFLALKVLVLAVLGWLAVWRLVQRRHEFAEKCAAGRTMLSVLILVFGALTTGLTVAATAMNGMNLEPRYVTVLAPWALAFVTAWALDGGGRMRVLALTCCIAWTMTEGFAAMPGGHAEPEGYLHDAARSGSVQWVRAHVAPQETLLTNRGADLALLTPNPVARVPRLPHSAQHVVTLDALDALADRMGARYLIHARGYPDEAKYDRDEFAFVRLFDDPARFPDRLVAEFPDSIIYRVGGRNLQREPARVEVR